MSGISNVMTIVAECLVYIAIDNNASRTPNELVVKKARPDVISPDVIGDS